MEIINWNENAFFLIGTKIIRADPHGIPLFKEAVDIVRRKLTEHFPFYSDVPALFLISEPRANVQAESNGAFWTSITGSDAIENANGDAKLLAALLLHEQIHNYVLLADVIKSLTDHNYFKAISFFQEDAKRWFSKNFCGPINITDEVIRSTTIPPSGSLRYANNEIRDNKQALLSYVDATGVFYGGILDYFKDLSNDQFQRIIKEIEKGRSYGLNEIFTPVGDIPFPQTENGNLDISCISGSFLCSYTSLLWIASFKHLLEHYRFCCLNEASYEEGFATSLSCKLMKISTEKFTSSYPADMSYLQFANRLKSFSIEDELRVLKKQNCVLRQIGNLYS